MPELAAVNCDTATGATITIDSQLEDSQSNSRSKQGQNNSSQFKFKKMCWNFQVSVAAASLEACLLLHLVIRACRSSEPRFRQQLSLLPILSSILLVEIIESIIWHNQHSLKGIQEADDDKGNPCPELNHILTLALWIIIWMQPYSVIFAARKSGDPNNDGILIISQNISVFFGLAAICMYLYAGYFMEDPDNTLPRMYDSRFKSYLNRYTCTYIGLHGHLHWTIAMAETVLTPNAFAYAMLFLSTAFAHPKQIVAVPSLIMMLIFFLQSMWFEGSFEAGSMWCFTAIVVFMYYTIQPWVWPCASGPAEAREYRYQFLPLNRMGSKDET